MITTITTGAPELEAEGHEYEAEATARCTVARVATAPGRLEIDVTFDSIDIFVNGLPVNDLELPPAVTDRLVTLAKLEFTNAGL